MNEHSVMSAGEMIMNVFSNIDSSKFEKNNKIICCWKNIIESIKSNGVNGKNLGANLYAHSKIIDVRNGIVLVETDHPGWIQTLKLYQNYILTGLRKAVPELSVSTIAFRVKGNDVHLSKTESETAKSVKAQMMEKIEKEELILKKYEKKVENYNNKTSGKEMPENLKKILDKLKNDMLTNVE